MQQAGVFGLDQQGPLRPAEAVRGTDAAQSRAIEVARVLLVVGLVFVHYFNFPNMATSGFQGMNPREHQVASLVNSAIVFFFFSSVPLLSTISGWLFFRIAAAPWRTIRRRMHSRVWSLFAPLLVWNAIYLGTAFGLHAAGKGSGFVAQLIDFRHAGLMTYVNAVTALHGLPIGVQFWFVRDLFVSVLVSPLLWLMMRRAPLLGAVALGAVWISGGTLGIFVRTDVVFFFYLGGVLQQRRAELEVSWSTTRIVLACYLALAVLLALSPLVMDTRSPHGEMLMDIATRAIRPVGVVACWGVALRIAATPAGVWLARYGGFAFFLHAAHFPLIVAVKGALWRLLPAESDGWMLVHYVASVGVTVLLAAFAGACLYRVAPALYAFLAGGRHFIQPDGARNAASTPAPARSAA